LTYVIAEPCIDVKDNSCVEVCPVDCIHPTPVGSEARGVRFDAEDTSLAADDRLHAGAGRFRRQVPSTTRIRT
jgi:formate hydrogenlyase subunit 6/NADH:ubiquinone oxidoreductase subunit I